MLTWLALLTIAGSLVTAGWGCAEAVRGVRPSGALLSVVAGLWVVLLIQAVIGTVLQFTAHPAPDPFLFLGYQLTVVVLLPAGAAWGIADRSRWGNGVLAIACATEAVLVLRMLQIWAARG